MVTSEESIIQELGFYARNCARGPGARRLECVVLERLNRLKGAPADGDEPWDRKPVTPELRARLRRNLHRILNRFETVSVEGDVAIRNAQFAQKEFGLDAIELQILLLLLRYERN
ncbi:MAG: hypothetical protein ACREHV_03250, partial [Rhizomicrobium sp.]